MDITWPCSCSISSPQSASQRLHVATDNMWRSIRVHAATGEGHADLRVRSCHAWAMKRALLATLLTFVIGAHAHAIEPEEGEVQVTPAARDEGPSVVVNSDEETSPFSASVLGEVSVGAGTFTPGPAARPYVNLLTKVRGSYRFDDLGLVLGLSFSVNVNAVVTELGNLQLWMLHEPSGERWKFELEVRGE